jgi:signal transduction histidine kinase
MMQNIAVAPVAIFILAAFLIALFRYRLMDIDLVIRRSIVYGALWLVIGAAYIGVATGLRRRLERLAGRAVFGERLSSYDLLSRFGETLESAFDVRQLAPRIATAVREGIGVRWARVSLQLTDGLVRPAGAAGIALEDHAVPEVAVLLTHGGELLGTIECGPKEDGRIRDEDLELLGTIARQAALGIHNGRLAAELSARLDEIRRQAAELTESRKRIVRAQDAERRRIERNIHDGVQQELVALVANLRLARNQLRRDPGLARRHPGRSAARGWPDP